MVPFRAFDRDTQTTWVIINYHPSEDGKGSYLAARDDDSDEDGNLALLSIEKVTSLRMVGFFDDAE